MVPCLNFTPQDYITDSLASERLASERLGVKVPQLRNGGAFSRAFLLFRFIMHV